MTLVNYDFSPSALRQLTRIFRESEIEFGLAARRRYEVLVGQAIRDLLANPSRPGAQMVGDRIHYHLRHSRARVPVGEGGVGRPRHILIARVVGSDLRILAIGYDAMVAGLQSRIEDGERP
ncbi:type II toxin-antitoxin system RelE/ParE family toxin [Acidisoma cellulosilytica]|uniref:Type II toxin-antitoxin system RelE/ParE family toxin n=1 Tax=Acidisoma cellulosilyticum TaxID=2802395 RepID=A0A963Z1B1_9PROT|nr:type II toxin-antitoxin system RelE/ParE family toxin [Acidisoma cellulosilyticum]